MNIHEIGVLVNDYVNSKIPNQIEDSLIRHHVVTNCGDQLRGQSSFMHYNCLSNILLITICTNVLLVNHISIPRILKYSSEIMKKKSLNIYRDMFTCL